MTWDPRNPGGRRYRVRVRETDDYLERRRIEQQPAPPKASPYATLFPSLAVAVMVACVSWSVYRFVRTVLPDWDAGLFLVAPVIAALVGFSTYHAIQTRYVGGSGRLRFMVFEWLLMALLLKVASYVDVTVPQLLAEMQTWFRKPALFFDVQTLAAFALTFMGWGAAHLTARDLEEIRDPTAYEGEAGPPRRLVLRFFIGGAILLVFTALNRVEFMDLLQTETPRVPGLILNVLLYFLAGLVVFALLRYVRMAGAWESQRVKISSEVRSHWLRYSMIFIAIAAVFSFLLPTNYTIGFLELVSFLVLLITYLAWFVVLILTMPLALLISLLFKTGPVKPMIEAPNAPLELPSSEAAGAANPLWLTIRSLIFWALAIAGLFYVVRGYVRDRPGLSAALRRITSLRWVRGLVMTLGRWWRSLRRGIEKALPRVIAGLRRSRLLSRTGGRARTAEDSLRDRVIGDYLDTLDTAQSEGVPRRDSQTPYEYQGALQPRVTNVAGAWDDLTEVFVQARYSRSTLEEETVQRVHREAAEVQEALRKHQDASAPADAPQTPDA